MPKTPDYLLLDGSSLMFRAFYAIPGLTNSQGHPTGALHGILSMVRNLQGQFSGSQLTAVFDTSAPTFRHHIYADYKANRSAMPEELASQIAPIHRTLQAMGLPLITRPGYEADDIIATYCRQAREMQRRVTIISSDKDLMQLVGDGVQMYDAHKQTPIDRQQVFEKYGVWPEQIIDLLCLTGDKVDNIPGVDKVGPKTAAKWLAEYGNLDTLLGNADKIGGKVGENLRASIDLVQANRKLVTLDDHTPLEHSLAQLHMAGPDLPRLRELLTTFELKRHLDLLEKSSTAGGQAMLDSQTAAGKQDGAGGQNETDEHTKPGQSTAGGQAGAGGNIATGGQTEAGGQTQPTQAQLASGDLPDAMPGAMPGGQATSVPLAGHGLDKPQVELVCDKAGLERWATLLASQDSFALDCETTGLDYHRDHIIGLALSLPDGHTAYIPCGHVAGEQLPLAAVLAMLEPLLANPGLSLAGQNLKFDLHMLVASGLRPACCLADTMLESYVLNSSLGKHDLTSLAQRWFGYQPIEFTQLVGSGKQAICFDRIALDQAADYAGEDAWLAWQLHQAMTPRLASTGRLEALYQNIEAPLVPVLVAMERTGFLINPQQLRDYSGELGLQLAKITDAAHRIAGHPFNLDSPRQLGEVLFGQLGLKPRSKTPGGAASTSEAVLQELAGEHELAGLMLGYRSQKKLKSTYTDTLPKQVHPATGRVHSSFHQAVTITGRLSSSNPNLQNLPIKTEEGRRIRAAFIAPPGHKLVAADYSQIELRIMAHLSGDKRLVQAFIDGQDIHSATAAEIFASGGQPTPQQRRAAKAINFGLMYGMSAFGLARSLGISNREADDYIKRYFARYPGVYDCMQATRELVRAQGYVETIFGRRLYLPGVYSSRPAQRQGAERAAINAPVQGSAADLIKLAMIQAHQRWGDSQCRMLLQVHDELVFEVPDEAVAEFTPQLQQLMAQIVPLDVPLAVDAGAGANWLEAHS